MSHRMLVGGLTHKEVAKRNTTFTLIHGVHGHCAQNPRLASKPTPKPSEWLARKDDMHKLRGVCSTCIGHKPLVNSWCPVSLGT